MSFPTLFDQPLGAAVTDRPLRAVFAETLVELHQAQRLRYDVFARELGARLHSRVPGLDVDRFDAYCRHLLVKDLSSGQVVGCTRVLTDRRARRAGGFYSEEEFDLDRVLDLHGRFAEIGRTCVHPDYRNGATIGTLWAGLAGFVAEQGIDYLIGCASVPLGPGGAAARAVYTELSRRHLAPREQRVRPLNPLPAGEPAPPGMYAVPPLLKGYLRLGAMICGEPSVDEDFGVADLLILLPTARLERRYARHFLGRAA